MNVQDAFLNRIRIGKMPVIIYLLSGHPIKGVVSSFNSFCLLVAAGGRSNLVYNKHAEASIAPKEELIVLRESKDSEVKA